MQQRLILKRQMSSKLQKKVRSKKPDTSGAPATAGQNAEMQQAEINKSDKAQTTVERNQTETNVATAAPTAPETETNVATAAPTAPETETATDNIGKLLCKYCLGRH
jgi:hypothetical protein